MQPIVKIMVGPYVKIFKIFPENEDKMVFFYHIYYVQNVWDFENWDENEVNFHWNDHW